MMTSLTVSEKGQIRIPAELRKKYNLKPGSKVRIVDYGGMMSIMPVMENSIASLKGALKGGPSLTEMLLKERAADHEREEAKIKRYMSRE